MVWDLVCVAFSKNYERKMCEMDGLGTFYIYWLL